MKKIIALLLSFMLIITLCACGNGGKTKTEINTGTESAFETMAETTTLETTVSEATTVKSTTSETITPEAKTTEAQTEVQATNADEAGTSEMDLSYLSELEVGDYCEFGSYPQTEIVLQASDCGTYGKVWGTEDDYIVDADLYYTLANLPEDEWNAVGDAMVDGNKYRRINAGDATYSTFDDGNYYNWTDSDTYHYFKYEPIKWRVLEQNGSDIFLLSELALDGQMYHTEIKKITWETSTIRSWLNGYDSSANAYGTDYSNSNFIDTAFTSEEQSMIKNTAVENKDNIKNGTEGGNDTNDKIFLLSEDEVYDSNAAGYGFAADYSIDDTARQAKSSTYAKAMGTYAECESGFLGNCYWWLRSPGSHPGLFILVRCGGSVYRGGQHADSKSRGVRPALYVVCN